MIKAEKPPGKPTLVQLFYLKQLYNLHSNSQFLYVTSNCLMLTLRYHKGALLHGREFIL